MKYKILDIEDVAKLKKVHPGTVYHWVERGILSPIKVGRNLFFWCNRATLLRREKEMAAKKAKKTKEKKGKKNQTAREGKITVLKKTESKDDVPKINAIVKNGLNAEPPLTYEEILKNVLKHHPESKFNRKHLAWYKNKLKEDNKKG